MPSVSFLLMLRGQTKCKINFSFMRVAEKQLWASGGWPLKPFVVPSNTTIMEQYERERRLRVGSAYPPRRGPNRFLRSLPILRTGDER